MFIGVIEKDGQETAKTYYSWDEWHRDTFNPCITNYYTITFKIRGKSYRERKNHLQNIAIEYSNVTIKNLYMSEYAAISDFFYKYGKKYGLLREFHENAIC